MLTNLDPNLDLRQEVMVRQLLRFLLFVFIFIYLFIYFWRHVALDEGGVVTDHQLFGGMSKGILGNVVSQ